jgi:hypothetical protein
VSQREKQFSEESESARSGARRLHMATVQRIVQFSEESESAQFSLVRATQSAGVSVEES